MQNTTPAYDELFSAFQSGAPKVKYEARLAIGETGTLITKQGDRITFGSKTYEQTARGTVIQLEGTADSALRGLTIYGKTIQNGTPSPDNPVPLESAGGSGAITVSVNDQTMVVATPNGLPGIPVTSGGNYTDENGQQWVCDEVDFVKGVYIKRINTLELNGSESWGKYTANETWGGNQSMRLRVVDMVDTKRANISEGEVVALSNSYEWSGYVCHFAAEYGIGLSESQYVYFCHSGIGTNAEWKEYLAEKYANGNPVKLQYIFATPIETPLSESELAAYAALHTSYPSTTILNDAGADMVVGYALSGEGPTGILVGATGADGGYDEAVLISMETDSSVFSEAAPSVGDCISSQIDIEMLKPYGEIPKRARLVPYVRLTDGVRFSEWLQQGVYYIDTRTQKEDNTAIEKIVIHGYDDMLKAEQDYPASTLNWPAKDVDVVREIAEFIDVSIDERTFPIMNRGYTIQYPAGYSCRDTLGYIAAMYAGCFIMSPLGELRLVTIHGIPKETRYLIEKDGNVITFGGDRILV